MRYLGDATTVTTDPAFLDLYNQQLTQYKAQLASLLPQLAKAQADVDAAQFKYDTLKSITTSIAQTWAASTAPLVSTYALGQSFLNQYMHVIPIYADDWQTHTAQKMIGNIAALRAYNNQYIGYSVDQLPDAVLAAVVSQQPSNILSAIQNQEAATQDLSQKTQLNTVLQGQNQQLQAAIQGWLSSAQAYAAQIGQIPTYQDILNQVKAAQTDHPLVATAVAANSSQPTVSAGAKTNPLLYVGLAIAGLFLARKKA